MTVVSDTGKSSHSSHSSDTCHNFVGLTSNEQATLALYIKNNLVVKKD